MALAGIADGRPAAAQKRFTTWNPKNYAPGLNGWRTRVLLSVNDVVRETGSAGRKIPDGGRAGRARRAPARRDVCASS